MRTHNDAYLEQPPKFEILIEGHDVPNMHIAVGFASRCWIERPRFRWFPWIFKDFVFDTTNAQKVAQELCTYVKFVRKGAIPE